MGSLQCEQPIFGGKAKMMDLSLQRDGPVFVGQSVDLWSTTHECWMLTFITEIDYEIGMISVHAKQDSLTPEEQLARLRRRTEPQLRNLQWAEDLLAERKELEKELRGLFERNATPGAGLVLRQKPNLSLFNAATNLDRLLGTCGAYIMLVANLSRLRIQEYSPETFSQVFESALRHTHNNFGLRLKRTIGEHLDPADSMRNPDVFFLNDDLSSAPVIGSGTFPPSKVHRVCGRSSDALRAVKVFDLDTVTGEAAEQLKVDLKHLTFVDHPNIIRLHEHYLLPPQQGRFGTSITTGSGFRCMVLDYHPGKTVEDLLVSCHIAKKAFSERFALDVTEQVLRGLAYMHALSLLHLDVRPRCVLVTPISRPAEVQGGRAASTPGVKPLAVLTDLGWGRPHGAHQPKFTPRRPSVRMAPEAWHGQFSAKTDVFAAGVILLQMLCCPGHLPPYGFESTTVYSEECLERMGVVGTEAPNFLDTDIVESHLTRLDEYWKNVLQKLPVFLSGTCGFSREVQALVVKLLAQCKEARPTAAEALKLEPFEYCPQGDAGDGQRRALSAALSRLVGAPKRTLLTRAMALAVVQRMHPTQLSSEFLAFKWLDKKCTGRVPKSGIEQALCQTLGCCSAEAKAVADALDLQKLGSESVGDIWWSDFAAACVDFSNEHCQEALRQIWRMVRKKGGRVNVWDMAELMASERLLNSGWLHHFLAGVDPNDFEHAIDWDTFVSKTCTPDCHDVAAAWRRGQWFETARDALAQAVGAIGSSWSLLVRDGSGTGRA